MEIKVSRFDVFLISLDPTRGHEIKKTRPCLVVSPDEMNLYLATSIVAPMTTKIRNHYSTRIDCVFQSKKAQIVLDQLRAVDKERFVKHLGRIHLQTAKQVLKVLQEMFMP